MSPRDAGLQAGRELASKPETLQAVLSRLDIDTRARLNDVVASIAAKSLEREAAAHNVRRLETEAVVLRERRAERTRERALEPAMYSIPRSVLFIILGMCAIVGDLAFLGTILAMLVGSSVVTDTGDSIAKVLLTDPRNGLIAFPEVTLLAISTLTSGFVVKLWYQHAKARGGSASKAWFWILSAGCCLVMTVLVLISAVRLQLPLSGDVGVYDTLLGRWATAVLGLSLPLVAAFFFADGIDVLGRRYELWRTSAASALVTIRVKRAQAQEISLAAAIETLTWQRDAVASPEAMTAIRSAAESEFECGYHEGIRACLSGSKDGALFDQLRSVTVARLARGSAQ